MQGPSSEPDISDSASQRDSQAPAQSEFVTVLLDPSHDVARFECPRDLDVQSFIQTDAWRSIKSRSSEVYVLPSAEDKTRIDAYYSMANGCILREELSNRDQRKAESGHPVPVFIIPWLGRDHRAEKGLGAVMIVDAAKRGFSRGTASWGLLLYAANAGLVRYYESLGFTQARSTKQRLQGEPGGHNFCMYGRYEDLIT